MPLTEPTQEPISSKTDSGKQAPDLIRKVSEAQTQTPETKPSKSDESGKLVVTFFGKNEYTVDLEGRVGEAQVERTLAGIYRSIGLQRNAARIRAQKLMSEKRKES